MENNLIFVMSGEVNENTLLDFKVFLRNIKDIQGKTIIIQINSNGGSRLVASVIINFFYFLRKYKKVKITTQCIVSCSAALRIFSSGQNREVRKDSWGLIHLNDFEDEELRNILREKAVNQFIDLSNGRLDKLKINDLNLQEISSEEMVSFGLADRISEFKNHPALKC